MATSRIMRIIYGIVCVVIFTILIPIILPAIDEILAVSAVDTNLFPGVKEFTGLVPLIAILGGLGASGFMIYSGIKDKSGATGDMMSMIWGVIVIFVFLILFPIILTQFGALYTAMNGTYTGAEIIPVIPLIIECTSLFGSGMLLFKGVRGSSGGGGHKSQRPRR
jgi:hypothetical protein